VLVIVAGAGVAAAASFSVHHGTEVLASQQATDVPLPPVAHAPQASPTSAPLPTIEAALPRPYEATTEGPVSLMKVPAALGGVASARAPTASAPRRPTGTPKNSGASAPESRGSALPTSGL
jgi:hypothetical protein